MRALFVALLLASGCTSPSEDRSMVVDCSPEAWATGWTRVGAAPVLEPQGWEANAIRPTSVLDGPDGLLMVYLGATIEPCELGSCLVRRTGLAASDDGRTWTRVNDAPILDLWESDRIDTSHGSIRWDDDAGVYEYFHGRARPGERLGIYRATSEDAVTWDAPEDARVLSLGEPGAWDGAFTGSPALLSDRVGSRMWFTGATPDDGAALGLANWDGSEWVKAPDPVLPPGAAGRHDETGVANPSVIDVEGCLLVAYKATSTVPEPDDETLGLAVSDLGDPWQATSGPILERETAYEADGVADPVLWVRDGFVWMAYGALGAGETSSIALARRTIPRRPLPSVVM